MIEPCMVALASARIRGVVCEWGGTENRSFDLEDVIPSDLGGGVQ